MCDPVTIGITTAGLGIAQTVGQYMSADAAYKQNKSSAQVAYGVQTGADNQREIQEQDQEAGKVAGFNREYDAAKADATARASDAGISGLSVSALLGDLQGQQEDRVATTRGNLANVIGQEQQEKVGLAVDEQNRINSVPKANPWNLALGIAGSVVGGINSGFSAAHANTQQQTLTALLNRGG